MLPARPRRVSGEAVHDAQVRSNGDTALPFCSMFRFAPHETLLLVREVSHYFGVGMQRRRVRFRGDRAPLTTGFCEYEEEWGKLNGRSRDKKHYYICALE